MDLQPYDSTFKAAAENGDLWMSSARSLMRAADLLWRSVSADLAGKTPPVGGHHADVSQHHEQRVFGGPFLVHAAPFLMLAGFAVENGLKAMHVKKAQAGATTSKSGTIKLSPTLHTHNLRHLAATAGISLSVDDTALLDRLTEFLEWAGRYPVGATANGQAVVQVIWASDRDAIQQFIDRVAGLYHAL
jgi:hypothetical protein